MVGLSSCERIGHANWKTFATLALERPQKVLYSTLSNRCRRVQNLTQILKSVFWRRLELADVHDWSMSQQLTVSVLKKERWNKRTQLVTTLTVSVLKKERWNKRTQLVHWIHVKLNKNRCETKTNNICKATVRWAPNKRTSVRITNKRVHLMYWAAALAQLRGSAITAAK